jgi:Bacterial SH3 domain
VRRAGEAHEPDPVPAAPERTSEARDDRQRYVVRGVVPPDTLNVRAGPNPRSAPVAEIPAGARGLTVTGRRRQLGPSVWWELAYQGAHGWVNSRFLAADRP